MKTKPSRKCSSEFIYSPKFSFFVLLTTVMFCGLGIALSYDPPSISLPQVPTGTSLSSDCNTSMTNILGSTSTSVSSQLGVSLQDGDFSSTGCVSIGSTGSDCDTTCTSSSTSSEPDAVTTVACDPFMALYGRRIRVVMPQDEITGVLQSICQGFMIVKPLGSNHTTVVNLRNILYATTDAI